MEKYIWPWIGVGLCLLIASPIIFVAYSNGSTLALWLPVFFGSLWAAIQNLVTWLSSPPSDNSTHLE